MCSRVYLAACPAAGRDKAQEQPPKATLIVYPKVELIKIPTPCERGQFNHLENHNI